MNTAFNHLIAKHGVLTVFSIAKKISKSDIKKISDKVKKQYKNPEEFNKMLNKEILNFTNNKLDMNDIPGLIIPEGYKPKEPTFFDDEQKIIKLNYLSDTIAKKLIENGYSKDEICYLILTLLNSIGLHDGDFKEFNKKYNMNDNSDENNEEDEDGYDDDFQ